MARFCPSCASHMLGATECNQYQDRNQSMVVSPYQEKNVPCPIPDSEIEGTIIQSPTPGKFTGSGFKSRAQSS